MVFELGSSRGSTAFEMDEEEDLPTISDTALRSGFEGRAGSISGSGPATGSSMIEASLGTFVEDLL